VSLIHLTRSEGLSLGVVPDSMQMPVPRIYEEEGIVTLGFGFGCVQSQMQADAPEHLVLSYTRAMADFVRFKPAPRNIAMIGLGGGSMAKWCYRQLPHADITVVEINPHVIALRERFLIPEDDHRFRILCENGADFVAKSSWLTDVLLVDGFNGHGQPPELCSQRFYDDCYQSLTASGMMVVNVCDDNRQILMRIRRSFCDRVLAVATEDGDNTVVFACKGRPLWPDGESGGSFLKFRNALSMRPLPEAA
jgi:spermidine synthase